MTGGEALYTALTGLSPRSEGKTTRERARDLVKRLGGSTRAAAQAAGVHQRTIQKWLKGEQEARNTARAKNADQLVAAQRAARVKEGRAERLRAATAAAPSGGLRLFGTVAVSEDIRDRWINPGKDIPNGALDALIERLITAGPDAVSADLNKLISDHYVRDMSITNIEVIDY
jgi:hypothetical protein